MTQSVHVHGDLFPIERSLCKVLEIDEKIRTTGLTEKLLACPY